MSRHANKPFDHGLVGPWKQMIHVFLREGGTALLNLQHRSDQTHVYHLLALILLAIRSRRKRQISAHARGPGSPHAVHVCVYPGGKVAELPGSGIQPLDPVRAACSENNDGHERDTSTSVPRCEMISANCRTHVSKKRAGVSPIVSMPPGWTREVCARSRVGRGQALPFAMNEQERFQKHKSGDTARRHSPVRCVARGDTFDLTDA